MEEKIDLSRERVAVLCGGMSGEREVSLRSGANVHRALQGEGIPAVMIDVGRDVAEALVKSGATVAYIALHGRYGEDGAVQGLLELLGLPYTGPGVQASAICMDKGVTKRILAQEGLATPEWISVSRDTPFSAEDTVRQLGLPVIVKPVAEGSSLGVVIVKRGEELAAAVGTCLAANEAVLVEAFKKGREVTTGVLGTGNAARALPVLELVSHNEFYDYEAKYTPGMTDFILPAALPADTYREVQEEAVRAHRLLGCRGVSRVDAMITADGKVWTIEVNTSPGMTDTSDLPAQAAAAGISFGQLVREILLDGLARRGK